MNNIPNKSEKRINLPLVFIGIICVLLIILFAASRYAGRGFSANKIGSALDAAEYLSGLGWEVRETPSSVKTVKIPAEFDKSYESYNNLQKLQGFDLTEYRSKTADMYTFKVLNYPCDNDVFANILVYDGAVIAGDLVSYAIDGFLTGLTKKL